MEDPRRAVFFIGWGWLIGFEKYRKMIPLKMVYIPVVNPEE